MNLADVQKAEEIRQQIKQLENFINYKRSPLDKVFIIKQEPKPHDFADPEWSLKDAIGDSIVTLIVLCLQLGYDVEECLTIAYNDIKDRKGVMIDDNFVKTKKRESANNSNDSASGVASN